MQKKFTFSVRVAARTEHRVAWPKGQSRQGDGALYPSILCLHSQTARGLIPSVERASCPFHSLPL
ncbi:hypothetical protein [Moorena producens]|uniref:hypothetical protein n=1 Tax=Moorena producens TaxID=1155739 RepID=UPI003C70C236